MSQDVWDGIQVLPPSRCETLSSLSILLGFWIEIHNVGVGLEVCVCVCKYIPTQMHIYVYTCPRICFFSMDNVNSRISMKNTW